MKKVLPIVSLVIICALAITTIVLALVPKSYAVEYTKPDYIVAYVNGKNETFDTSNDYAKKIYDEILNKFDKSSVESAINSLLQGRLGTKSELEYNSNNTSITTSSSSRVYLRFVYNSNKEAKVSEEKTFAYTSIVVEITNEDALKEVKLGLMAEGKNYYNYYYTTLANFSDLHEYLTGLELA